MSNFYIYQKYFLNMIQLFWVNLVSYSIKENLLSFYIHLSFYHAL